ncbi:endonuclease domain-containing protein [Kribbella sp. CWNU-51]
MLDCIRTLTLPEALAVADTALRAGCLDQDELVDAAAELRGPHRRRILRIAGLADGRSESVLESALRALLIERGFEGFVPQVVVRDSRFSARLDLANPGLRVGLEAEGFEHHSTRRALVRDCRRQVNLTIRGWSILRFSWEDVMFDGEWVVSAVEQATGLAPLTVRLSARPDQETERAATSWIGVGEWGTSAPHIGRPAMNTWETRGTPGR